MTTIQIDTPDGPIDALLSTPSGQSPWPGVVVIHDAFGYGRDKQSANDRIARAGYLALTPNMYARGGRIRCISRVMKELQTQRGRALTDILAARDHLKALPECSGQVGIAGFCMGGQFALVMSPKGFGAAAPFYSTPCPATSTRRSMGRARSWPAWAVVTRWDGARPKLRKTIADKNITADVKVYPGAGHSFANELPAQGLLRITGFGYNEDATEDAWRRVFAFFGEHLAAGTTA